MNVPVISPIKTKLSTITELHVTQLTRILVQKNIWEPINFNVHRRAYHPVRVKLLKDMRHGK